MNIDHVLKSFNDCSVEFLLIGGMNYLLRHQPVLTFDIDLWVRDTPGNRRLCEKALCDLDGAWGPDEKSWGPVTDLRPGWLDRQPVFCLTSPHGAIDVFRRVSGLDDWAAAFSRGTVEKTSGGVVFRALSDADMLSCQLSLPENERKRDRVEYLSRLLEKTGE